jgi:hypothetical protein
MTLEVLIDPFPCAAPLAIRTVLCPKATTMCSDSQRSRCQLRRRQGGEGTRRAVPHRSHTADGVQTLFMLDTVAPALGSAQSRSAAGNGAARS